MDETAIRGFLRDEYPKLVGAVGLACGSSATAEDAVQEALARAWERSERGERIESLRAWVAVVAMNLSRSRWRRVRAERRALAASVPVEVRATDDEEVLDVRRALRDLPPRQREATVLRYYLGLDVEEVARAMGISVGTVKTSLHRSRGALARSLRQPEEAPDRGR
ncbi:MAG TPA: sigma-70 family RNA polymerase sigma factor [Actinomycetota bacterium]|nr:sigma-70 family RNA polymerase sigma factor [Actinomycetota bacterium]